MLIIGKLKRRVSQELAGRFSTELFERNPEESCASSLAISGGVV
jgi:hypothetical protein